MKKTIRLIILALAIAAAIYIPMTDTINNWWTLIPVAMLISAIWHFRQVMKKKNNQ